MYDPKRVLRDLLRFFKDIEKCGSCIDPEAGLDTCHTKRWRELMRQAEIALREEPKSN